MNFISRHKKLIALVAVFSFMYLVGIVNMPLQANDDPQQPGAIEKVGTSGATTAKKSPIIPIIIGVVVVGAIAAVLILVVFKTKYDIVGSWAWTYDAGGTPVYTFVGDKASGTYTNTNLERGIYAVDGKDVTITWEDYTGGFHIVMYSFVLTGKFDSKTTMSGSYSGVDWFGPFSGTWTAVKQ